MSNLRVCFVTTELEPFTGGSIGAWLSRTLDAYKDRSTTSFEVLLCIPNPPAQALFAKHYPGIVLHNLNLEDMDLEILKGRTLTRQDMSFAQWRSFVIMCALEQIERKTGPFQVIEFIDWSGIAYSSLNAKRLGRSFKSTVLAIRLHGAENILRNYETRGWDVANLIVADLERQALLDADVIVAHLAPVADLYRDHFAFDQRWRDNVLINLPPISVGAHKVRLNSIGLSTPIVFAGTFQSSKRPDIFARATARLLAENVRYRGHIHFLDCAGDGELRAACENAFPTSVKSRVQFGAVTDQSSRDLIIPDSIAVFPGVFETFCFAAYEANTAGAAVLLNARNPCFGESTPWIDGSNCVKFDGTSLRLFEALQQLIEHPEYLDRLCPISVAAAKQPYWEIVASKVMSTASGVTVTAIVPHRYEDALLLRTIDTIFSAQIDSELVVAREAAEVYPAGPVLGAIAALQTEVPERISIIERESTVGVAELIIAGLEASRGEVVAIVPGGVELLPGFLEQAAIALSQNPDHDAVLPCYRVIVESGEPHAEHWLPLGAAIHASLCSNRMSPGCAVVRRSLLAEFPPNESLSADWIWDVLLRAAMAGRRFLTTDEPSVQSTRRVLLDYSARSEPQRRQTLDTARRVVSIGCPGARVSLSYLGDLELSASTGPLSDMALWQDRATSAESKLSEISQAVSVKIALRVAHFVGNYMPWLRTWIRTGMRRN